jgi:glycosyltransferase involved in cell wall biosynthesis
VKKIDELRIAWLFPSLQGGSYWHPILSEFTKVFPKTIVYAGSWPGFSSGFENTFTVEVVGDTKFVATLKPTTGYTRSYILPSWGIINRLFAFKPQIIFTSAFSLWTALALLFKLLFRWRVIVVFDGVSAGEDNLNSGVRILVRRAMSPLVDAFVTNSQAGKTYLETAIGASKDKILTKTYLVPDAKALLNNAEFLDFDLSQLQRPIFLYVGQITSRKGIHLLLEACYLLKEKGYIYTLIVVGSGDRKLELEKLAVSQNLQNCVKWIGSVAYHQLGIYYTKADVFICPTLQDIWGMVVMEAMIFGKPILCSKWAGSAETIVEGENGYLFDPHDVQGLAKLMQHFIDNPASIAAMSQKSLQSIAEYTPNTATNHFVEAVSFVYRY